MDTDRENLRRHLLRAGLVSWAVPAINVATPAPALAQSAPCPVMPTSNQWTVTTGGQALRPGADNAGWLTYLGTETWAIQWDNSFVGTNSSGANAVIATQVNIPVEPCVEYTFSYNVAGNTARPIAANSGWQTLQVFVNNQELARHSTPLAVPSQGGTVIPTMDATFTPYSVTYTATAAGNVPFLFFNVLSPRPSNRTNDDILVTIPEITCRPVC